MQFGECGKYIHTKVQISRNAWIGVGNPSATKGQ